MKKDHGRNLSGAEMCEMLDEFMNGANEDSKREFLDHLVHRTHRTLQQSIASLFMNAFHAWADLKPGQFDGRNFATIALARVIVDATKDSFYKRLPLI